MSRLLEFPDETVIDLHKVVAVYPVGGDPNWLSYQIVFEGNISIKVMENRKYADADGTRERTMPRDQFIEKWQQYLGSNHT
jgi:hypothetical protein